MKSGKIDMHTHSIHSFDGNHSCKELCRSAIAMNADILAITDHCDIDGSELDIDKLCKNQLDDIHECIKEYGDKLDILAGIELGQGIYRRERTRYLLESYEYDFVLGSLHNLENEQDFYFLDYSGLDVTALLKRYFNDVLELVEFGCFDSLAHLTYPLRYTADAGVKVDLKDFSHSIDEILSLLAEKEKALEINTSGLYLNINDTLPDCNVVKRFRELGGKYITVGSDSHYAERLYRGCDQGIEAAKAAGFGYITIYRKRQPELIAIK